MNFLQSAMGRITKAAKIDCVYCMPFKAADSKASHVNPNEGALLVCRLRAQRDWHSGRNRRDLNSAILFVTEYALQSTNVECIIGRISSHPRRIGGLETKFRAIELHDAFHIKACVERSEQPLKQSSV